MRREKIKKRKNPWKIAFWILAVFAGYCVLSAFIDEEPSEAQIAEKKEEFVETMKIDDVVRDSKVSIKGNGKDTVTVLMYMNGSDLETDYREATTDLTEMVSGGSSDQVNFLVQTMNTKKWSNKFDISNSRTQRFELSGDGLKLVDDSLSQLNCCDSSTLRDFIVWGTKNYPADRYILLFWDHGGGPVYGYGYDNITESEDSLSTDEIQQALKEAGVFFDFIGMDCCLMSSLEFCCSVYDYCDYCILAEDFEPGYGWNYSRWVNTLYENTSIEVTDLAKIIIDDMVSVNESTGENAVLALIDESYMRVLYSNWVNFAYANESSLLNQNYSRRMTRSLGGRVNPNLIKKGFFSDFFFGESEDDADMADYYVTDIMAVAGSIDSEESAALKASLDKAIVYMKACGSSTSLSGISVTLPYGDSYFYDSLKSVFTNCGFSADYVNWLSKFVSSSGYDDFYDYDEWDDSWDGWDSYEDDYDWSSWGYDCFDGYYYDDYCDDDYYYSDDNYDYDNYCYDDYWDWGWSSDDDYYYDEEYGFFDWLW